MHSRLILVAAAAFAAALPVSAASAKKPDDNGKSDKAEKKVENVKNEKANKGENVKSDESGKPANDNNLLLKGTVSAVNVTGGLVTVTVTSGKPRRAGAGRAVDRVKRLRLDHAGRRLHRRQASMT